MPPLRNERGRSRSNATDPDKSPDQRGECDYALAHPERQVEFARISKSARAELRIGISNCSGRPRLFLRQFETTGSRVMRETGKGVVFDASHVQAIVTALQAAASTITAIGMLPPRAGGSNSKGTS